MILVVSGLVLCGPQSRADGSDPSPEKTITWTAGPTNVTLGDMVEVEVVSAYKLTDAAGARLVLGQNNPVPKGLIGLLQSATDRLRVVLSFDPVGYVKYEAPQPGSYDELLKKALKQKGIAKVTWELPPRAGSIENSVEYEIRVLTKKGDTLINYTAQVLGRQGVLTFTAVFTGGTTPEDLKPLLSRISFKKGEQYGDFKGGNERPSDLTLAQVALRLDEPEAEARAATAGNSKIIVLWIGVSVFAAFGIAALVVAGGRLIKVAKNLRRQAAAASSITAAVRKPQPMVNAPEGLPEAPTAAAAPTSAQPGRNGFQPKLAPTASFAKARNGRFAKGLNGNQKARRREFDYNRYFIDLMSTVSSHGLALESTPVNGRFTEIPQVAAPANPEVNGNGHAPAPYSANSEMIANQTTLIQEQRRLIQEQAKLIEEKSKLIAEKNQLLHIQQELFDQKLV